jgi:hypothetical protein
MTVDADTKRTSDVRRGEYIFRQRAAENWGRQRFCKNTSIYRYYGTSGKHHTVHVISGLHMHLQGGSRVANLYSNVSSKVSVVIECLTLAYSKNVPN